MKLLNLRVTSLLSLVLIATQITFTSKVLAQSSRYPTEEELQRLSQEFEEDIIPKMRRTRQYGNGRRSPSLDSFVKAWSKVDPEASIFLGLWNKTVTDIMIYPSSVRGRVCVIRTLPGGSRQVDISFGQGNVVNGRLKVETAGWYGDYGKTEMVLIRNGNYMGTASASGNKTFIQPFSSFSDSLRPIESLQSSNTANGRKVVKQFYALGCTSSLPSK
jgi:hypothetical protein